MRKDTAKARAPKIGDAPAWAACHEVWKYDFETKTATIIRFELLCRHCSLATHIGRAVASLNPGQMDAILKHIERVNQTDSEGVQHLFQIAESTKTKMEAVKWKPRIHQRLLTKYPALRLIRL